MQDATATGGISGHDILDANADGIKGVGGTGGALGGMGGTIPSGGSGGVIAMGGSGCVGSGGVAGSGSGGSGGASGQGVQPVDRHWIDRTLPGTKPAARRNHVIVFDESRNRLVLFAGADNGFFRDVWEWDPVSGAWLSTERRPSFPHRGHQAAAAIAWCTSQL